MLPEGIDFSRRSSPAELPEWMDQPCSREEMRACLRDLARVNRWMLAYRPTLDWLDGLHLEGMGGPVRILDVACGYGDTLRRIEQWAEERAIAVELTGLDLNADCVALAAEASGAKSRIQWVAGDVFDAPLQAPVHLVVSSLFTHHLENAEIVRFVRWMEEHAEVGWFVNDLSRAAVPYHLFAWFARLMRLHRFVQHDGPISIARAFQPQDWRELCAQAGLDASACTITSYKPARLCVSRSKPR